MCKVRHMSKSLSPAWFSHQPFCDDFEKTVGVGWELNTDNDVIFDEG